MSSSAAEPGVPMRAPCTVTGSVEPRPRAGDDDDGPGGGNDSGKAVGAAGSTSGAWSGRVGGCAGAGVGGDDDGDEPVPGTRFDRPKSSTFTWPRASIMRFAVLTSRCR